MVIFVSFIDPKFVFAPHITVEISMVTVIVEIGTKDKKVTRNGILPK